jgi:metal-responsive CopG/Arc/MetJ family transcriptional regulator
LYDNKKLTTVRLPEDLVDVVEEAANDTGRGRSE